MANVGRMIFANAKREPELDDIMAKIDRNIAISTSEPRLDPPGSATPPSPRIGERVRNARQSAAVFGVSLSTWKRGVGEGRYPRPVMISPGRVGWLDSELMACLDGLRQQRDRRDLELAGGARRTAPEHSGPSNPDRRGAETPARGDEDG